MSHDAGYISLDEFHNLFAEWMQELDEKIIPVDQVFERAYVMHHFENLRYEVVKRSKMNLEDLAVLDKSLADQLSLSTRISSAGKTLNEQVKEAQEAITRATAPSLEEQLVQRRNLGKAVARAEALKG